MVTTFNWNVNFVRPIQDLELESVVTFLDLIYSGLVRRNGVDQLCWKPSASGVFYVKSFYKVLCSTTHSSFPWKPLWRLKVPTKVSFFMWTADLGRILATDNLQKRRVVALDGCCMCKKDGEFIDHLLLHCHVARELWNMIFSLFGVH